MSGPDQVAPPVGGPDPAAPPVGGPDPAAPPVGGSDPAAPPVGGPDRVAPPVGGGEAPIDARLVLEAVLFQSAEPLDEALLQAHVKDGRHVAEHLAALQADYAGRGIRLERHGRKWAFRTAAEVAPHLERVEERRRRLSKAAMETLAIIAYQQPVTRAEIEAVRGVPVAKGTLDQLVEAGWVMPKGRREVPGRPVTWVTTAAFLDQFGLAALDDLPRLDELEAAGLFRSIGAKGGDAALAADGESGAASGDEPGG